MSSADPIILDDPGFTYDVLELFYLADLCDGLMWSTKDGVVTFSTLCSDVFWWGTADAEGITPDDLPLLHQCLADLREVDQEYLVPELFAARKRGLRPMRLWLYGGGVLSAVPNAKALPLFEAAGPERDPKSEG